MSKGYILTIRVRFSAADDPDARQKARRLIETASALKVSEEPPQDEVGLEFLPDKVSFKLQETYTASPPRNVTLWREK